jgi:tetratricopeptide (TPR) repeat protein
MGAPDLQGVAQCSYCGTKIVLPPTDVTKEQRNLGRYKELCQAERQAKNWGNLLKYAGEILEIDPRDTEAWIDKALASGLLSSYLIPRLDEAFGYLQKASELSPDDRRIVETRDLVRDEQFNSYVQHALGLNQQAREMKGLGGVGREYAVKYTWEAMHYLVLAYKIKPDDLANGQNIKNVSENGWSLGIKWQDEPRDILLEIEQIKMRQAAVNQIDTLRKKLRQREVELEKLRQKKKGFFVNMEIEDVQNEMKKISQEIKKLEKTANTIGN